MCGNQIYSLIGNASPYEKLINFIMKNDFVSMKKHRASVWQIHLLNFFFHFNNVFYYVSS